MIYITHKNGHWITEAFVTIEGDKAFITSKLGKKVPYVNCTIEQILGYVTDGVWKFITAEQAQAMLDKEEVFTFAQLKANAPEGVYVAERDFGNTMFIVQSDYGVRNVFIVYASKSCEIASSSWESCKFKKSKERVSIEFKVRN